MSRQQLTEQQAKELLYNEAKNGTLNGETLSLIIEAGAGFGLSDGKGPTPLHIAISMGHADTVETLIGAYIEQRVPLNTSNEKSTPLHWAASSSRGSRAKIMELLIEAYSRQGLSLDDIDHNGCTPLQLSARHGYKEDCKRLIQSGANLLALSDSEGVDQDLVSYLRNDFKKSFLSGNGFSGVPKYQIKQYVDKGFAINDARDRSLKERHLEDIDLEQRGLLGSRVSGFTEDHIKQFVANGFRINERDAYGDTVLHCIYREPPPIRCSERDIWFLISEYSKSKLPINEKNDRGATPLCWALKHGHDSTPLIQEYRRQGISLDEKDDLGYTLLHWASGNYLVNSCKCLIAGGANVFAKDSEGKTPYEVIGYGGRGDENKMNKYLIKELLHNAEKELFRRAKARSEGMLSIEIIQHYLDRGADINAKNSDRETILHLLVKNPWAGEPEIFRFLIKSGADIYAQDYAGQTPLKLLEKTHSYAMFKRLYPILDEEESRINKEEINNLFKYARSNTITEEILHRYKDQSRGVRSIDAKDAEGFTPLHRAAERGHVEACRLLMANGSDILAENNDGKIPAEIIAPWVSDGNRRELISLFKQGFESKEVDDGIAVDHEHHRLREELNRIQNKLIEEESRVEFLSGALQNEAMKSQELSMKVSIAREEVSIKSEQTLMFQEDVLQKEVVLYEKRILELREEAA